MSTEPYTPSVEAVCARYFNGDYSGCNRNPDAEFDRFIAKVKADALREAANEYADSGREQTHGVTTVLMFMHNRATRIEGEA
ncbi:hypothetical protein CXR25_13985 [Brevibacterium aurantiacum]|uniref:hypothetical protein n=1 Tax=Brevibacterium aurantiacum TaxID=273384 RepID=UPI000F65467D|nr:hypothetical protein [Brevibacterium aurantiacum]AZL13806.1 hypothetical protein CXR25_13985 [Brevibacterium aurantiacum]